MVKRIFIVLILILALLAVPIRISSRVRDAISKPFHSLGNYLIQKNVNASQFFESLGQISTLRERNNELSTQIISLQQELAKNQNLIRENETLRSELDISTTTSEYPKAFARVITKGINPFDRTSTVDAGSNQGIKPGQPALVQGALIGRVISVRPNSSVVRFITSKESRLQAWINQNREKGSLVGDGRSVYLEDISQGIEIPNQAIVETSGLGGSLPQGILIGSIKEQTSKQSDLSQRFLINPAKNPEEIESMFILLTDGE